MDQKQIKHNESMLKYLNKRYANDHEFKKMIKTKNRDRYRNDIDYKKRLLERANARYLFLKQIKLLSNIDIF